MYEPLPNQLIISDQRSNQPSNFGIHMSPRSFLRQPEPNN